MEYSLPSGAMACKRAMDEIERNMRPDPKKMARPQPKKTETKHEVFLTLPRPSCMIKASRAILSQERVR